MTKVTCTIDECEHYKKGICQLEEIEISKFGCKNVKRY